MIAARGRRGRGVTYLEIQVAMVILGFGLAGLCPLVVMQLKLLKQLESPGTRTSNLQVIRGVRLIDGVPDAPSSPTILLPQPDARVRRLGIAAAFRTDAPPQVFTPEPTEATADDGDGTFVGTWTVVPSQDANAGGYRALPAGTPEASATWTFEPIGPGRYRVMVSWVPSAQNAPDVAYTFTDGSGNPISVPVDQTTAPGAGPWRDLGSYSLGASLQVRVGGSTLGQVVADAVRIGPRNDVTIVDSSASGTPATGGGAAARVKVVTRP